MLIFAGHHVTNQGAVNNFSSELIESSILGALISSNGESIFVGSAPVKDKINIINTTCDSLNIDIHFTTSINGNHGPKVFYKDNCNQSEKSAHIIQSELNQITSSSNIAEIGYYHNKKKFGIDYFLQNDYPSIIICPEHWINYTNIMLNRCKYSGAIQRGLTKLKG